MKRKPLVDWPFKGRPVLTAILSFFLPGIPHIGMGEIGLGLIFFLLCWGAIAIPGVGWIATGVIRFIAAFHAHHVAETVYKEEK